MATGRETAEDVAGDPDGVGERFGRRRLAVLAVVIAAGIAVVASGLHRHVELDGLVQNRAAILSVVEAHPLAAAAGVALLYMAVVALSIPGAVAMTLACGFVFGAIPGGVLAIVSATAGATALFLLARGSVGVTLRARAGPGLQRLARGFREDSFSYLLFLRLMPVAPFWFVNLAAAILGVRTRVFVGATVLGILPATFALASIGAGIGEAIDAGGSVDLCGGGPCTLAAVALASPALLAGLLGLGVLSLAPVAVKYWRRDRKRT